MRTHGANEFCQEATGGIVRYAARMIEGRKATEGPWYPCNTIVNHSNIFQHIPTIVELVIIPSEVDG